MLNNETDFIAQGMDSCCFVYAVANFQIWKGKKLPDLEQAKEIACCNGGSTINAQGVVDFFNAGLEKTVDIQAVFKHGGIINIRHPIWNGHSFLVFPTARHGDEFTLTAVNSWLGPVVACGLEGQELKPFVCEQLGYFWVATDGFEVEKQPAIPVIEDPTDFELS